MVARRRSLPDLPALVRGHRRGRDRRPARDHGAPRPSRVARDRRHLAQSDDALAQRRLGLRRRRLLRRRSGARHARGPRRADRRGGAARDPRPARSRPQPHQRPPRLVPAGARRPRRSAPRLLRLGGPEARRCPAQQLGELVRRAGLDARRALGPVLPAQLPAHPTGPELVERGRARGLRRHPALLVRARDRRLAHRRHARHRQGSRAARRPRGDRRGPPPHPGARTSAGVLDEPPRGPRRPAALAHGRRRAGGEADPGGGDLRARSRAADAVLRRGRGRAQPGLQLPVRPRRARGGGDARDRRGCRGGAAAGVVAGVDGLQPRRGPARDALGAGRSRSARGSR